MTSFIPVNHPLIMLLVVTLIALIALQSMHVFFRIFLTRGPIKESTPTTIAQITHEIAVLAFLACVFMVVKNYDFSAVNLFGLTIPLEAAYCISALPLATGAVFFSLGKKNGARTLPFAIELALFAGMLTCALSGLGAAWLTLLVATIGILLYQTLLNVQEDEKMRRREITRFSIIDTINQLPSGVLYLSPKGRPLIINQSMRGCLIDLRLPNDVADLSGIWKMLQSIAQSEEKSSSLDDDTLLIKLPCGSYHLFQRSTMQWQNESHLVISTTDVTEEAELNMLIESSNSLIEAAGKEIQKSLANVQSVAQNEALLSMRSKVHDIIGQRLSILHRLIEDDDISDESIAGIKPLLNNLLTDLRFETFDSQTELRAIVSAFELIDVSLEIRGNLPENEQIAQAFVTVIREATTNAVRHAQAHTIQIELSCDSSLATMLISNEYNQESKRANEDSDIPESWPHGGATNDSERSNGGSGIPNMRKAIEEIGGTFDIQKIPMFEVRASVPLTASYEKNE